MQLSISKYSDLQRYVFISLRFKLFTFPRIIKKSTTNKMDFPQGSTETASAYLTTHFSVGKTTFWLIKNYTFEDNVRLVSQDGCPLSSSDNFGRICLIFHAKNLLFITNYGGMVWKSSNGTNDKQHEFSSRIILDCPSSSCWSIRVTWRELSRGEDQAVSKFDLHFSANSRGNKRGCVSKPRALSKVLSLIHI